MPNPRTTTTPTPLSATSSYAAIATVDLATVSGSAFNDAVEKIAAEGRRMRALGELPDIALKTGKMKINARSRRRCFSATRAIGRSRLGHVQDIAHQQQLGLWRLAQPIIFDEDGNLQDGQHRLLGHTSPTARWR